MRNLKRRNTNEQKRQAVATLWRECAASENTKTTILEQLAEKYKVAARTISRWESEYQHPKQKNINPREIKIFQGLYSIEHQRQLMDKLKVLISCMEDPHLETAQDVRTYPLQLNGEDWRLMPLTFLKLCTPDLDKPGIDGKHLWDESFDGLFDHLKNTDFKAHYLDLWSKAAVLNEDYQKATINLIDKDEEFDRIWQKIRGAQINTPSRYPDAPEPDWEEFHPPYSHNECDLLLLKFTEFIPDVHERLCELEEMLDKLNDDLNSPTSMRLFVEGHCSECP